MYEQITYIVTAYILLCKLNYHGYHNFNHTFINIFQTRGYEKNTVYYAFSYVTKIQGLKKIRPETLKAVLIKPWTS